MKKILIVEDEQTLAKFLEFTLKKEGYEIFVASNYDEAMNLLKVIPDLILLDLLLPGRNGIDILKEMRSNEKYKNIPVIVLSNFSDDEHISEANKYNILEYLVKSQIDITEVIEKINQFFKTKK